MIHVYYMKLVGDCPKGQSLALLYGEEKKIVISGNYKELYRCLPQERKDMVKRAKNETVGRKRLYSGAFLQHVLSEEMRVPMECLRYRYNTWGKPELDSERMLREQVYTDVEQQRIQSMYFNLSHSGDYVVLAVGDCPVGIDVEHKTKGYDTLSERFFCKEEYEDIIHAGDEVAKRNRFLEYWTTKEAYIKCVGEGMRIPLNSFLVRWLKKGLSVVEKVDTGCTESGLSIVEKRNKKYTGQVSGNTLWLEPGYCVSVCAFGGRQVMF